MHKLMLADDHGLVRETLAEFLCRQGPFTVSQAESLDAAIEICEREGDFDLVLLDYAMPGMNALSGLDKMRQTVNCPVAIISGAAPPDVARRALRAGAAGFLPKTLAPMSLTAAVRKMLVGETFMPMALDAKEGSNACAINLTPREQDVLRGVSDGKSNKEIARDLEIQEVTVKLHVKTLSRKLDARNRTHAAMLARDLGLA